MKKSLFGGTIFFPVRLLYVITRKIQMNISDKEILFFKQYSEKITPDEEVRIQELLSVSEENRLEMDLVRQIVSVENEMKDLLSYDTSEGYLRMKQKTKGYKETLNWSFWLVRIAAILVVPLLISTLTLIYINQKQREALNQIDWMEVSAAPGVVSRFELPDQSKVWLNSGSTLRYPSRFTGHIREVELNGEGYFEVKSDKENPFYVITNSGAKVMAHGTRFNVNAYDEYEDIEAVLVEGKIDFLFSGKNLRELKSGEQAVFNKNTHSLVINPISIYEKTAWKDGKIVFRNASLEDVFHQLSRRYNVDIVFHDDYKLSDGYRCRVTFMNETIQQIFSYLEIAAPIRWTVSTPVQKNDSTLVKQRVDVWLKKK